MSTNLLGELVRRHRHAAGLTLRDLAPLIHLKSYSGVSNRELGRRGGRFSPKQFEALVAVFPDLTLEELFEARQTDIETSEKHEPTFVPRLRPRDSDEWVEARTLTRMITGEKDGELIPMLRAILAMQRRAKVR